MDTPKTEIKTINDYINSTTKEVGIILQEIRQVIKEIAPEAIETISYQMPTFKLRGKNLVHFAAWKTHIGFYPTPSGTEKFQKELTAYKFAKGSIRFPLNQPIPMDLVRRIVKYRVECLSH
jgi:uncharacterized protein YdhG (YjbR/CyaY superfamily)